MKRIATRFWDWLEAHIEEAMFAILILTVATPVLVIVVPLVIGFLTRGVCGAL